MDKTVEINLENALELAIDNLPVEAEDNKAVENLKDFLRGIKGDLLEGLDVEAIKSNLENNLALELSNDLARFVKDKQDEVLEDLKTLEK